jgi:aryl-alcohol dehydrogenase-like predicted oxidoreductase
LKAATLQSGLAHPAVVATILGAGAAEEVEENFRMVQVSIPGDLWTELKHEGLINSRRGPDAIARLSTDRRERNRFEAHYSTQTVYF